MMVGCPCLPAVETWQHTLHIRNGVQGTLDGKEIPALILYGRFYAGDTWGQCGCLEGFGQDGTMGFQRPRLPSRSESLVMLALARASLLR
jgi:hypothetical protein